MRRLPSLALLAPFLLAACGTQPYAPPAGVPTATLEFNQPDLSSIPRSAHPRLGYEILAPAGARGCLSGQVLVGDYPIRTLVEAGDKPVIMRIWSSANPEPQQGAYNCSLDFAFYAEPGAVYLVSGAYRYTHAEHGWLGGGTVRPGDYSCGVTLQKRVGDTLVKLPLEKPPTKMFAGFNGCERLDPAQLRPAGTPSQKP